MEKREGKRVGWATPNQWGWLGVAKGWLGHPSFFICLFFFKKKSIFIYFLTNLYLFFIKIDTCRHLISLKELT